MLAVCSTLKSWWNFSPCFLYLSLLQHYSYIQTEDVEADSRRIKITGTALAPETSCSHANVDDSLVQHLEPRNVKTMTQTFNTALSGIGQNNEKSVILLICITVVKKWKVPLNLFDF